MWGGTFDRAAEGYDAAPLAFFDEAAAALVRALDLAPGSRVVDAATGTGKVAAAAARAAAPAGLVVGVDLSEGMLARARANTEGLGVRLVRMDLAAPGLRARAFDAATLGFAISFLPRPVAAVRALGGALRGGGRLGVSTPAHDAFGPPLEVFRAALAREGFPPPVPPRPAWRAADRPEHLRLVLGRAGFGRVRVVRLELGTWLDDGEAFWAFLRGSGYRGTVERLPGEVAARVHERVVSGAESLRGPRGILLPVPTLIATASRPRTPAGRRAARARARAGGRA